MTKKIKKAPKPKKLSIDEAIAKLSTDIEGELKANNIIGERGHRWSCPVANYLKTKCISKNACLKSSTKYEAIEVSKSNRKLVVNGRKLTYYCNMPLSDKIQTWIREFDKGLHQEFERKVKSLNRYSTKNKG